VHPHRWTQRVTIQWTSHTPHHGSEKEAELPSCFSAKLRQIQSRMKEALVKRIRTNRKEWNSYRLVALKSPYFVWNGHSPVTGYIEAGKTFGSILGTSSSGLPSQVFLPTYDAYSNMIDKLRRHRGRHPSLLWKALGPSIFAIGFNFLPRKVSPSVVFQIRLSFSALPMNETTVPSLNHIFPVSVLTTPCIQSTIAPSFQFPTTHSRSISQFPSDYLKPIDEYNRWIW